ncbi:hypothetical protein TUM4249_20450 [Shewanella sp. KT0246]|nr:hypothetical protein TUM4249_20450 [Shewanella sp. KT0246]
MDGAGSTEIAGWLNKSTRDRDDLLLPRSFFCLNKVNKLEFPI